MTKLILQISIARDTIFDPTDPPPRRLTPAGGHCGRLGPLTRRLISPGRQQWYE